MRVDILLTPKENSEFAVLPPLPGEAFRFWWRVAKERGLDSASVLWKNGKVTALPIGHGKHWCWPDTLNCRNRPTVSF